MLSVLKFIKERIEKTPVRVYKWALSGRVGSYRFAIPKIYEYKDRIEFDFIVQIDKYKFLDFYNLYNENEEAAEENNEYNNPLNPLEIYPVSVNGKLPSEWHSEYSYKVPVGENGSFDFAGFEKKYKKYLHFGFYTVRTFSINISERFSALEIEIKPQEIYKPLNMRIEIGEGETVPIEFSNPFDSGINHIAFSGYSEETVDMMGGINVGSAVYSTDLGADGTEYFVFDSAVTESNLIENSTLGSDLSDKEASAVGIIGGADGPTAIFFSAPDNQKVCMAVPSGKNDGKGIIRIKGAYKKPKKRYKYLFVKSKHKK